MRACRSAFTLIELLVVITIIVTITAALIPVMQPVVESRRIREAARGVNTFISGARARAIGTQRSTGVQIVRIQKEQRAAIELHYIQVPLPYLGDVYNATFSVSMDTTGTTIPGYSKVKASWVSGTFRQFLVKQGDQVQLGYHSELYEVVSIAGSFMILKIPNQGRTLPWPAPPNKTSNVAYRVLRRPKRISSSSYFLPEGAVIDLSGSGIDNSTLEQFVPSEVSLNASVTDVNRLPLEIMFSSAGAIEYIRWKNAVIRPLGSVHLLVGRREKVAVVAAASRNAENTNWLDLSNLWVSIGRQTGQVTTSDMAPVTGSNIILETRRFARERLGMGGR